MKLAILENDDERKDFFKLVDQHVDSFSIIPGTDIRAAYLGGFKHNNSWVWMETGTKINLTMTWSAGEPNNFKGGENCLGIMTHGRKFGFNDCDCVAKQHDPLHFICEKIEFDL